MFNKKRAFIIVIFIILMFFLMTFGGSNGGDFIATRNVNFIDGINNETISSQKVEVGKDASVPKAPYHKGYVFYNWLEKDTKKEVKDFTSITSDLTVLSNYKADINNNGIADDVDTYYNVTFYDTIAKANLKVQKVLVGMNATAPKAASHTGYTFDGWDKGYSNVKSNLTVNTVYSKEAIAEYFTVTFVDGDTNKVISKATVRSGLTASLPEAPSHKYRLFSSWTGTYTNVTKDETVTANYIDVISYDVTFNKGLHGSLNNDKNSVSFSVKDGMSFAEGKVIIPEVNANPGYTFTGFDIEVNSKTVVNNSMIITALYQANTDTKYTINYIKVKGDAETKESEIKEGTTDTKITLAKDTLSSKYEGYTLNEGRSTFEGTIAGDGTLVLNIYYDVNHYDVTIDPNGGENPTTPDEPTTDPTKPTTDDKEYGDEITLPEAKRNYTLTYSYYNNEAVLTTSTEKVSATLLGYCANTKTCTNYIKANTTVTVKDTVTYYAIWGNATKDLTVKSGSTYQTATTVYTFANWNIDNNELKYSKVSYAANDLITLLGNTTLVAKYDESARKYDLTINYLYTNGKAIANSYTASVANGVDYTHNSPVIAVYTADKTVVSGTMPTSNKTIDVTYTAKANTAYKGEFYKGSTLVDTENRTGTTDTTASVTDTDKTKYTGYTFDTNNTNNKLNGTISGDGSLVLKVYYTANANTAYKVEFYKGSTLVDTENRTGTTDTTASVTNTDKTKYTGYTFDTNNTNNKLTGNIAGDGSLVIKVYYTANDYTLTYNMNLPEGIVGASVTPSSVTFHVYDVISSLASVTSTSHTFEGWFTAATGGTEVTNVAKGTTHNVTVYAHWKINSYNVTIDPNGGENPNNPTNPTNPTTEKKDYGSEITLPKATKKYTLAYKVKNNIADGTDDASFTLLGYCTKDTCTTSELVAPGTVVVTGNVTYKAIYSTSPAELTVKDGSNYEATENDNILYTYTFAKWTLEQNTLAYTKTDYIAGDKITLLGDTTLKAINDKSAKEFMLTINYEYKDVSDAHAPYKAMTPNGSLYNISSPVIDGYTPSEAAVSGVMLANDVKYMIIYHINGYKLIYNLNIPNGMEGIPTKPADVSFNIKTNTFNIDAVVKGINSDVTVYAHWTKKSVTTNLDPNGGTLPEGTSTSTTDDYGTMITLPTATKSYSLSYQKEVNVADGTENANLTFQGWCKNATSCTSPIAAGTSVKADGNATYYAIWDVASPVKTVKSGVNYQNTTTKFTFTKWTILEPTTPYVKTDYNAGDSITLLRDTTLKALYESEAVKYNLTINYLYSDNTVAHDKYSADVANGSNYSVISPIITGYTADTLTIAGVMPAADTALNVLYYPNNNTAYKVLFYKDNVLQTTDTLSMTGTTNETTTYTPDANKYDNYKLDNVNSILSRTIAPDGSLELKVYYTLKQANISVNVTKTLNKADSTYTGNTLATNDTITYKVVINNTGEGYGYINIKDALIADAISKGLVSVTSDSSNVASEIFSNIGKTIKVDSNGTLTYTITLKALGKAGDVIESQVSTKVGDNATVNANKDTYNIETKVTVNAITKVGSSVVLVLDNSQSMKYNGKLDSMKTAAKGFINSILENTQNPNNEVCIVVMPYNYNYTAQYKCSSTVSILNDFIDNKVDGKGVTPYEAAFQGAISALNTLKTVHPNNNSYTIFLSDGMPTRQYYFYDYAIEEDPSFYLDEAATIKQNSAFYTIGYEISGNDENSTKARNILASIATTGKAYSASTTNLQSVFNDISTAINGEAKSTTAGKLALTGEIDTTKDLTFKVTHLDGTVNSITKTYANALSEGYITSDNKLNATKFAAGDVITLTYYTK